MPSSVVHRSIHVGQYRRIGNLLPGWAQVWLVFPSRCSPWDCDHLVGSRCESCRNRVTVGSPGSLRGNPADSDRIPCGQASIGEDTVLSSSCPDTIPGECKGYRASAWGSNSWAMVRKRGTSGREEVSDNSCWDSSMGWTRTECTAACAQASPCIARAQWRARRRARKVPKPRVFGSW